MNYQCFNIQFHWKQALRELQIKTEKQTGKQPVQAIYKVYRNDVHLFSIYPTMTADANKEWEIVEKDREANIPAGFAGVLGRIIDDACITMEYNRM